MADDDRADGGAAAPDGGGAAPEDDRFSAFRVVAYRRYWLSRFLSTISKEIFLVALAWQIYDLTRDPFILGLVGLTQFLPALVLMLVTGIVADRFGRRRVMAGTSFVFFLVVGAVFFLTLDGLGSVGPIFALLTVLGISNAFYGPASGALVANLVPSQTLGNAIAWNSSAWQLASIAGPAIGGLLYGLGAVVPYGLAAILLGVSTLVVLAIPQPAQKKQREPVTLDTLFGGIGYIRRERVVFGAISLDLVAVLLGGAIALMPVYARDILHVGPVGLGMLRAAPGIGALIMVAALARFPVRDHAGRIMLATVCLFGIFTAIFGASTVAWLSILALIGLGAADMISVVIRETLIQLWTPDELRGRVSAVNGVFVGASNELGEFRAGTLAALIGAKVTVVLGGLGAAAAAGLWGVLFPKMRDVRRLDRRE